MTLRPIDLQILLKQTTEVARREQNEKKKKVDDQKSEAKVHQGATEDNIKIDHVEISEGLNPEHKKLDSDDTQKKQPKKEKKGTGDLPGEKTDLSKSQFRGNFLDIKE